MYKEHAAENICGNKCKFKCKNNIKEKLLDLNNNLILYTTI